VKGVFLDVGGFSSLKNKGVLLSGIGRGNEFFFQVVISWVGVGWFGKKGGIPFFSLYFPFS
jgi:hypothetical protein